MSDDPYSRSYWRFADEFPDIYADDSCYALWSRLRDLADMAWPSAGTLPYGTKRKALQRLIDAELVVLTDAMHYRIRGMDKERERRQANASASAKARWSKSDRYATAMRPHSDRNATAMLAKPSLAETSQAMDATAYDTYYECTGWTVSEKALPFLREIVDGWGHQRTATTLRRLWDEDPDKRTILSRVKTALLNEDDAARAKAEERRKRGAIDEIRTLENAMPEEQRQANLVRLRDEMAARGLV